MLKSLVFVSGASSGLGLALVRSLPFDDARTIDISRRGASGCEHFAADLADPKVMSERGLIAGCQLHQLTILFKPFDP